MKPIYMLISCMHWAMHDQSLEKIRHFLKWLLYLKCAVLSLFFS